MPVHASHLTNQRLKFISSARNASKSGAEKRRDDAMRAALAAIEPWPAPAEPSDRLSCLLGPSANASGDRS